MCDNVVSPGKNNHGSTAGQHTRIAVIFSLAVNGTKFVPKHSRMTMFVADMTAFYCVLAN